MLISGMGICNQIYDRMPTESFMQDSGYYHCKYKLTPLDNERLEFVFIDVKSVIDEF
jgi:hypothetical protein